MIYKQIEVLKQYGWKATPFEKAQIGDVIRFVIGHETEMGKEFRVTTEPQRCKPEGNWTFNAEPNE